LCNALTFKMSALSLIIAVYKNIPALDLILRGLEEQSFRDFEVIIAEDNDGLGMKNFIQEAQKRHFFTTKHIFQPDRGFQKDKALNKAVALSASDYLVFIDGDCILHKHFLKEHFENKEEGLALFGRRVMLSENMTNRLYALARTDSSYYVTRAISPCYKLLITRCKRIDCAFYLPFLPSPIQSTTGIWGCNWSIHKKHIIAVNGFDEDYIKPGFGEDTDIEWRLFQMGIKLKKIKFKAIQYHLHHTENYADTLENENLMLKKRIQGKVFCENGLNQYL
jgi:glycosyltransferase involved in cell wall biosynthesis